MEIVPNKSLSLSLSLRSGLRTCGRHGCGCCLRVPVVVYYSRTYVKAAELSRRLDLGVGCAAGPYIYVYYYRTYEKAVSGGGEREKGVGTCAKGHHSG